MGKRSPPESSFFLPPVALPNTPAVAPQKKWGGTTPGNIIVVFSPTNISIPTIPPKKLAKIQLILH